MRIWIRKLEMLTLISADDCKEFSDLKSLKSSKLERTIFVFVNNQLSYQKSFLVGCIFSAIQSVVCRIFMVVSNTLKIPIYLLKWEYVFTTAIYYNQLLRITLRPNMTYFWIKVLLLRPTFQLSYYCYGHTIMTLSAKYIFSN